MSLDWNKTGTMKAKPKKNGHIKSVTDLVPDNKNIRRHSSFNLKTLEDSLHTVGAARSIVIDEHGKILAGNGLVEAAINAGIERVKVVDGDGEEIIAVRRSGLSKQQKARLAFYDNYSSDTSAYDYDAALLAQLAGEDELVKRLAQEDKRLRELLKATNGTADAPDAQMDRADELLKVWKVKRGDVWEIGRHRLMCGDAMSEDDTAQLMNDEHAQLCFTSPPYNAGVAAQLSGNTHLSNSLYVNNDDNLSDEDYLGLLSAFTQIALGLCDYVFVNIQPLAGNKFALIDYWYAFKDKFCDVAIWDKGHAAPLLARRVMNSQFEFILMFSESNQTRAVGTQDFRGTVSNVYQGEPQRNNEAAEIHGATMPIHLPLWILNTFTNAGELIYEPFAGTGTTLVAAELVGRRAYGMEISEVYTAVCLERLKDCGLTPQRVAHG